MDWDRRTFLQTLLTWGISQTGLTWWQQDPKLQRYYQTLAAPSHRKLALLVGIDNYGDRLNLKGCTTDVERQRELLIYRFGFDAGAIVTLTNQQATREAIETTFREHLLQQARSGDVVLFHFSGYGCQVAVSPDRNPLQSQGWQRGFVTSDALNTPDDLLEETLLLLGRSLETDKLTLVLDTSHHPSLQPLQGNLRGRSLPHLSPQINPEELTLQAQLKGNLQGKKTFNLETFPGIWLTASRNGQVAAEVTSKGFSAGLFTYALTQYLWQVTPASKVTIALARTTEAVVPLRGEQQQPQQRDSGQQPIFAYYLLPQNQQGAEAVITALNDATTATIKLTGLPVTVLQNYGTNSCFEVLGANPPQILQLRSREGLSGKVRSLSSPEINQLKVGQLLQECLRCLPRSLGLTVALDRRLERIERVDATSAFSSITTVSEVIVAGEKECDCVLSSIPLNGDNQTQGYGLLSAGGSLLPNTLGTAEEAIKSAVERLSPTLEKILAVKFWELTENEGSSRLAITASLENLDGATQPLLERRSHRWQPQPSLKEVAGDSCQLLQLARNSRLAYRVTNHSQDAVYCLLLGIDASGQAIIYLPSLEIGLKAGESRLMPAPQANLSWRTATTSGLETTQLIVSRAPFANIWQNIEQLANFEPENPRLLPLSKPLAIAKALLQDLQTASAVAPQQVNQTSDSYSLAIEAWTTLSFVYQVV